MLVWVCGVSVARGTGSARPGRQASTCTRPQRATAARRSPHSLAQRPARFQIPPHVEGVAGGGHTARSLSLCSCCTLPALHPSLPSQPLSRPPNCRQADIADFAKVNAVYATYFDPAQAPPARATFAVKDLPLAARVEIDAVAVLP